MATKRYEVVLTGNVANLQSALRQATNGVSQLSKAAKGSKAGVGGLGSALGQAGRQAAGTSGGFQLVARSVSALGDVARTAVGTMAGFVGAQAVVNGLAAAWRNVGQATLEFDTNMRNVNSLIGLSDRQLGRLSDQVLNLSTRLPQSASELSAGLYDIASSGFAGADGMMVLESAATAASAGLTDTATSSKAITAVLNAYGLSAAHAGEVSDTLFQTVNLGVVNFEELSQSVGDWVGTAATLGVSIDDASAAFATMTLSGIQASEAGTALNRVMLALIKPSEQMATLLRSWGYESGQAAVDALGFEGVMSRIRVETGGTTEAMAGLFPEVRGLKGGLALLANEGKNYTRVAKEMGDAHKGVGASQKVLNEQAKSLSYQLKVLGNRFIAEGIQAGRWAAPGLAAGISAIGSALREVGVWVGKLADRARPGIDAFGDAIRNAARVVADLAAAFGPVVAAAAGLAAAGLVDLFNVLGSAVRAVTGFLDRHRAVAAALAGVYLGSVVPALWASVTATAALTATRLAGWFAEATLGARQLVAQLALVTQLSGISGGLRALGVALAGAFTSVTAIVAAAAVAIYGVQNSLHKSQSAAKEWATGWLKDEDLKHLDGLDRAVQKTSARFKDAQKEARKYDGVLGSMKHIGEGLSPFNKNVGQDTANRAKEALKALRDVEKERNRVLRNLRGVAGKDATRADLVAVGRLADALGYDLTQKGQRGAAAVRLTREAIEKLGRQAGYSSEQVKHAAQLNEDALGEQAKAAQEFQQKVSEAFTSGMDILDVTKGLEQGQKVTGGLVLKFYREQVGAANTFMTDMQKAYAAGYDPQLLARLMQAGPETAGPVLTALVSDTSRAMVDQVNFAEAAIRQVSARAVEMARLQQVAMRQSDTMARALPVAMRISAEKARQGAGATAKSVGEALKLSPADVAAIAETYRIEFPSPKVTVRVDKLTAETDLSAFLVALSAIPKEVTTVPIVNDPTRVKSWWADLKDRLMLIPGLRETVAKISDPQQALLWWQKLQVLVATTNGQQATVTASVVDNGAVATLTRARDLLAEIRRNPSVTLTVHQQLIAAGGDPRAAYTGRHSGQADGGIVEFRHFRSGGILRTRRVPDVAAFAAGSERHIAQIARPGEWRLWAEPETGGEAYIPLAAAKRARSLRILEEVARRFGVSQRFSWPRPIAQFAAGGITVRPAGSTSTATTNVTMSTTVNVAGTDRGQVIDLERRLDERDRRLAVALRGKR